MMVFQGFLPIMVVLLSPVFPSKYPLEAWACLEFPVQEEIGDK